MQIWQLLIWPMLRMLLGMALGLLLANVLEGMNWSGFFARLARPLLKFSRFGPVAASAFALAAISPQAANALMAENYSQGKLTARELVLLNLFNSVPASIMHLPSILLVGWAVIGWHILIYAAIIFLAACMRSSLAACAARFLLPVHHEAADETDGSSAVVPGRVELRKLWPRAWQHFCKRLPGLIFFSVPIYLLMYWAQKGGLFEGIGRCLATLPGFSKLVPPEALGIVIFQLVAESGAGMAAAGVVMASGTVPGRDIVIALLAGNILATPLRAIRHQLPVYSGYYKPLLAMKLVTINQLARSLSLILLLMLYALIF